MFTAFSAKIVSSGDLRYHAKTTHSQFEMASDESASKPADTLLASLCGCLAFYVGDYLKKNGVKFSTYTLEATSTLVPDNSRFADIDVAIGISGVELGSTGSAEILQYITKCYIYQTLLRNSKISLRMAK